MISIDLTIFWAAVIGFAVMAYVVMDGFDLGIGILFPSFAVGDERDQAMNSIAPVWDGNETWLVMGGGGLLAAFPLAYAILLPATYPLMIAMLLGLVFRGVAFEFRWRDAGHRALWDMAFSLGSVVAALAQGITLGAILQGVRVENDAYAGGWLDWLSPFSLLTGIAVVIGYALLGATWLIWKTEGTSQRHARRLAFWLGLGTLAALAAVSAATPFLHYDYWRRWFALPGVLLTAQVPLLVAICAATLFWSLRRGFERLPFAMALALFLLGFLGLGISIYPYIVPRAVTIWDAAAPPESQSFMLVGALVIVPVILAYTGWAYWVFRGKAGIHGYH
ncbi:MULTISPECIES: cytochrome d ubiquinol oxidase subunit II [Bradyrhizobium]|jgi:cytochrome bd ubiquinol oxidase subunit II|uniref:cytochrome d ubiquinol oxidase subunit II n=1 Tax=Bradyrhizobium TaxID=374 RepID=UPI0004874AF4|nr:MULTISPECIES: cytochrome d ubiquinol oxidase subunit II [Bradyrhizobium]MCS3450204.1 cytochrome d ubiquinol oxidase subunit II [Bradyrhizobium elkanii]MCS3558652.1 cytochrome d ubiquinol oxidase subunit II [Bradyrhizobium elkanii]MCW2151501.1 cytochrome d ubiquinol oxidase subunit II [Bradyrhizobium elkanii]MCW2358626.1 cytochrome d ubiquinol oxidase subunit II [Bradyrhizobium elkanii]MCW2375232.1 cytochrome d ubiquinol oxidase subunit II [Bradyrhizobium elkanii]